MIPNAEAAGRVFDHGASCLEAHETFKLLSHANEKRAEMAIDYQEPDQEEISSDK